MVQFRHCLSSKQFVVRIVFVLLLWCLLTWISDHLNNENPMTIHVPFWFNLFLKYLSKKLFFIYPLALMLKLPYSECYLGFLIYTKEEKNTQKVCIEPSKLQHTSQVCFQMFNRFQRRIFSPYRYVLHLSCNVDQFEFLIDQQSNIPTKL